MQSVLCRVYQGFAHSDMNDVGEGHHSLPSFDGHRAERRIRLLGTAERMLEEKCSLIPDS